MPNYIQGNDNLIANRDIHITIVQSESETQEKPLGRYEMISTLFQYKDGKFPEFHNLLCDYAKSHFKQGIFKELNDEQLTKLYQYHQQILLIAEKLNPPQPAGLSLKAYLIKRIRKWFKE